MKPRIVIAKNKIIQITTSDVTYVGLLDCYQSIFRLHNNWWLMLETMFQPRPWNLDRGTSTGEIVVHPLVQAVRQHVSQELLIVIDETITWERQVRE